MAIPGSAVPFLLRRQSDTVAIGEVTSTIAESHGVARLDADVLRVQWSTARQTHRVGRVIQTDRTIDPVREVSIPLEGLAGAEVRWHWRWPPGVSLVLRAADLRAFETLAGDAGLVLEHPAELTLGVRWQDRALAREFAAEVEMQLADQALSAAEARGPLGGSPAGAPRLPRGGAA